MNEPILLVEPPEGDGDWLAEVKTRIYSAQQWATLAVNTEMLCVYWQIGHEILEKQVTQGWGAKVVEMLSRDLRQSFPGLAGFSRANLMYMRAFAEAWQEGAIGQQAVGQLPWGHNIVLLTKLKDSPLRLAYAQAAAEFGWSRSVLEIHIKQKRIERQGQAVSNFERTLPQRDSDLARESLKDPYRLDFWGWAKRQRHPCPIVFGKNSTAQAAAIPNW